MPPGPPLLFFFHEGHSDAARASGAPGAAAILAERDRLGGKGASLHALAALGFRVPAGFTIPVAWCAEYHAEGRLPPGLEEALAAALRRLEDLTGKRLGAPQGLRLAVRSGAAESMPGMLDTVLGVDSPALLESAVSRVFDSWRSERAEAYRREKGVTGLEGTAVTVQEMCPAEAAGVAFTVDPRTGTGSVLVEAVRGLGESLVSGAVTPDRVLLARPGLEIEAIEHAGESTAIDAETARSIAREALRVEERFGFPVDVEWAVAAGEVHLLQARAIRAGRDREIAREVVLGDASRLVEGLDGAQRSGALFVRHNLDETLSHPTPMTWDLLRMLFRGPAGLLGLYRDLGFRPSKRVLERGFLALVGGRLYAECGLAAEVFFGSDILRHDAGAVRRDPALLDAPPGVWASGAATPAKMLRVLGCSYAHRRRLERLRKGFLARFRDEILPRWSATCRERAALDLRSIDTNALVRELGALRKSVFGDFPREALKLTYLAGEAHRELVDFLERRLGDEDGRRAAMALLGTAGSESGLEHGRAFSRLMAGEISVEDFLETHGHRGPGEMDLASPRWREDPEALRRVVESLRGIGGEARDREPPGGASVEASVLETLARCGTDVIGAFRERIERARELLPWREAWKHEWMRGFELVRRILLELDRRLGLEGQVFHVEVSELEDIALGTGAIDPSRRELIARRRAMDRVARSCDLPDAVGLADLERLVEDGPRREADPAGTGTSLQGTPIASGAGTGRVWICESPREAPRHGDPYVLVCASTDPGWMPLLARARALVVERGGALSHGAIVCRDLGVPAVVLPGATRRLEDGAWVRVDGERGRIVEVEEPGAAPRASAAAPEPPPSGAAIPPEPWVPLGASHPGRRAAVGLSLAIVLSVAIVGLSSFRPVSRAIAGAIAPALDWTLRAGFSPFGSIASAAVAAAMASTAITFLAVDRRRLRGLRGRLSWYRSELRKRKVSRRSRGAADPATVAARKDVRETLERRARQDSMDRALELLRPMGWACLPFVLVLVWVEERFPAHPIRAGTVFEVEAFFEPIDEGRFLRFARMDLEDETSARLEGDRYRPVEPNAAEPGRGPYHAVWPLEALEEGRTRMIVTARDSRMEATLDWKGRPDLLIDSGPAAGGGREVAGLRVNAPPFDVLFPEPMFRALAAATRWLSGGREITPAQAAFGPVATFIVLAVLFALVIQRCAGLR